MEIITNSRQMKQCDANTIAHYGIPSLVLMERAALGVVDEIQKRQIDSSCTLVICGLGNNGGDGLAVARLLHLSGSEVRVLIPDHPEKMSAETRQQYEILKKYEISFTDCWEGLAQLPTLVIDAVFGIGLSRNVEGVYGSWIENANKLPSYRLAIDIPSGINADDGQVMGCGFFADLTVTFAFQKIGHLLYPGCDYSGEVTVKDIGISKESWLDTVPSCFAYGPKDLEKLPPRRMHSNKGTYGRVLVMAGKKNMAGAAAFSAKSAMAAGCGLVKVFTPKENRVILQQLVPEAILETYESGEEHRKAFLRQIEDQLSWADAVVLGPGIGTDETARCMTEYVLSNGVAPLVLDADGLNLCAASKELLRRHRGPVAVTPHMGEMARLMGLEISHLQKDILTKAKSFAGEYQVVCVLKDARTVTALPNGVCYINSSGNHGMATAGAGDVLTGIIAALIAQGMDISEAAVLGVYLHGCSGDAMVRQVGHYGMMASDIIEGIRRVTAQTERKQADGAI